MIWLGAVVLFVGEDCWHAATSRLKVGRRSVHIRMSWVGGRVVSELRVGVVVGFAGTDGLAPTGQGQERFKYELSLSVRWS
jgi:hypothetical protein